MSVARVIPKRIQDQQDTNFTLGAGQDGYAIIWNNGTGKFDLSHVIIQTPSATTGARNITSGGSGNSIAGGADACSIFGGGTPAFPNLINGTTPDLCTIVGGYDNIISGVLANGVVASYHSIIGANVTHGLIAGGSTNQLSGNSDYAAVVGGANNNVSSDYGGVFCGNANTVTGNFSVILGGTTNTVAGLQSVVGGANNVVNGNNSLVFSIASTTYGVSLAILGGSTNNIGNSGSPTHGDYCGMVGGLSNTIGASANSRFTGIVGGRSHNISGEYQGVVGGQEITLSGQPYQSANGYRANGLMYGAYNHAAGYFAAIGDAQFIRVIGRVSTTNATPTQLRLDGSGQRLSIPNNTTWAFRILVCSRRTDSSQHAAYRLEGLIHKSTTAGSTAVLASSVTVIYESDAAWDFTATADTTNGALALTFTGAASATIRTVAVVEMVQVQG